MKRKKPSPDGEGWVRRIKIRQILYFDPSPHPNLLPEGEGTGSFLFYFSNKLISY
jgi:hypothetical protein